MQMFAGEVAPEGWLFCNGAEYEKTSPLYSSLFEVIGEAFSLANPPSAPNLFRVPDLQYRFPVGASPAQPLGSSGGEANVILTTSHLPPHNHGMNQTPHIHGSTQSPHIHDVGQHPHQHGFLRGNHRQPNGGYAGRDDDSNRWLDPAATDPASISIWLGGANAHISINPAYANVSTQAVGGGAAHNNMPPFVAINYIIKY